MKTIKTMACIMALTIVGTTGLVSCKNDKDKEPEQQTQTEQERGEVKTQFAIALPNQISSTGMRRMPSTTVQRDGASQFQGMTGITLIPFAKEAAIVSGDTRLGNNITTLGDVMQGELGTNSNAKVYNDVSIPLATSSFLFYARSRATGNKFEIGSLVANNLADNTKNPADFTFDLEQIVTDNIMLTSAPGGKLLKYLTTIANASDGTKKWYQYIAADDAFMTQEFATFSTMKGLSSFEVERVLTDLYKTCKPLAATKPMASAIVDSIENPIYATVNASDEVELIAALDNFPAQYNLPEGSVNIKWDAVQFTAGDYDNMATLDKYVYPAQLWYYANSQIKTSNTSKQSMYDNVNNWATVLAAHTDAVSVNSLTRAVAITNPIQYAVARFDTQVRLKQSSLEDNSATVTGQKEDIDCSAGFPVTAILIGGQSQVKFDFTTNGGTEYTIYDTVMTSKYEETPAAMMAMPTDAYSAMNHTLVLENGTSDVRIAIEMKNTTGVDFYGAGGQLIPKGGKFYVVAQLNAAAATETDGHVFLQDFTTTAKLTLKDLKTAYNTIPDLRTPQLEIGFSVDLTWQNGHVYEVDFN